MSWNPFRPSGRLTPRGGHTSSDVPYTLPKVTDRPGVGATVPDTHDPVTIHVHVTGSCPSDADLRRAVRRWLNGPGGRC